MRYTIIHQNDDFDFDDFVTLNLSHALSLYQHKESAKLGDNIMPQFARAAIMNHHKLGDLREIYFLAVLEAGNPDQGLGNPCSLWGWHPSVPLPSFCWWQ